MIKIYQNYGSIEDSKVLYEFELREKGFKAGERVSMFVTNFFNGKLSGFIALSYESDILILDAEGKVIRIFKNAHDAKIATLKIVSDLNDVNKKLLVSAAMDGKIQIYSLN
jgi:hypothetical protein